MKREFSAGTILFREEKDKRFYFLIEDSRGNWGFPKGNLEKGESSLEAALRETKEETGLKEIEIFPGFRKSVNYFYNPGAYNQEKKKEKIFKTVVFFLAKTSEKKFKLSFESKNGGWFSFQDSLKKLKFANYQKILQEAEEFLSSPCLKIFKNFSQIAKNDLRFKSLLIAAEGLISILPENFLPKIVRRKDNFLFLKEEKIDLNKFKRVFLISFGKASSRSALVLSKILKEKITKGFVLDPSSSVKKIGKLEFLKVYHPFPEEENILAGKKVLSLSQDIKEDDLVIFLISGGGSASLFLPKGVSLTELRNILKDLYKKGATIEEINIIRKHLSEVKGGNLAKKFFPATIFSLIISDVPGNDLSIIASGPTVKDFSTLEEAKRIFQKYSLDKKYPQIKFSETPKEERYFKKVKNILVLTNKTALLAMKKKAEEIGFQTKIISEKIEGEARKIAKEITKEIQKNQCLLFGGETTVKVKGRGKGGRNQELALAALENLKRGEALIALASDGIDNSQAAGAIVDWQTKKAAKELGLVAKRYLENNDSFHFFEKTGDLIFTGPTGTNVSDLILFLRK
ncbi:DUF4147 domain-containing protein [bacterium]|nr:DUF4147 domain-containing protein [bacterium]